MRGLIFWLVLALIVGGGWWQKTTQQRKEEMLPAGSKLLAQGLFSSPVGGMVKVYHLPDGQGRIILEKLKIDKGLQLVAYLTHNPNAQDITLGSVGLGKVTDARIQALDIPKEARQVSYSHVVLVRPEQQVVWAKTQLERAY